MRNLLLVALFFLVACESVHKRQGNMSFEQLALQGTMKKEALRREIRDLRPQIHPFDSELVFLLPNEGFPAFFEKVYPFETELSGSIYEAQTSMIQHDLGHKFAVLAVDLPLTHDFIVSGLFDERLSSNFNFSARQWLVKPLVENKDLFTFKKQATESDILFHKKIQTKRWDFEVGILQLKERLWCSYAFHEGVYDGDHPTFYLEHSRRIVALFCKDEEIRPDEAERMVRGIGFKTFPPDEIGMRENQSRTIEPPLTLDGTFQKIQMQGKWGNSSQAVISVDKAGQFKNLHVQFPGTERICYGDYKSYKTDKRFAETARMAMYCNDKSHLRGKMLINHDGKTQFFGLDHNDEMIILSGAI